MSKFILDDEQAQAVLDMRLSRLAHLEVQKLVDEKEKLLAEIARIEDILNTPAKFNNELITGWRTVAKKFGDARRTQIMNVESEATPEDEVIIPENCMVILTHDGGIKRIPSNLYKTQKRNGKGQNSADKVSMVIRTSTIDTLLVFTNKGKMYRLGVAKIPEGDNKSKEVPLNTLLNMQSDEVAQVIYSQYKDTKAKYILFATKHGYIKRTALSEYAGRSHSSKGIAALKLREGDSLANVTLIDEEDVVLITKHGRGFKISSNSFPTTGRVTIGTIGISLDSNDELLCVMPVRDSLDDLAVFTTTGEGKRLTFDNIPQQNRGTKGIKLINNENTIAACALVQDTDEVLIFSGKTSILIKAKEIPVLSCNATGVSMIQAKKITSVSKI